MWCPPSNSLTAARFTPRWWILETGGSPDLRIALQGPSGSTYDIQKTTGDQLPGRTDRGLPGSLSDQQLGGDEHQHYPGTSWVSTGITATLVGTSGGTPAGSTPVGITVTRSTSALSTALSGFADAYNAAVTEVGTQRGQLSGALQGNSIVNQLAGILSGISTYSSNSGRSAAGGPGAGPGHQRPDHLQRFDPDVRRSHQLHRRDRVSRLRHRRGFFE